MTLTRRSFLAASATLAAGCSTPGASRRPQIVLRSSWQTVNIGDIAHTPGMLRLLEEHVPQADVRLWPNPLSDEVFAMLRSRFPRVPIIRSIADQNEALRDCDFFLHGSGPGLVGAAQAKTFRDKRIPYGFGGVTISDAELKNHSGLLMEAQFIFCRDTLSLAALNEQIPGAGHEFGPDATFFVDVRDDAWAEKYLREAGLEAGKFACFVPRLRWTPYWKEGRKMAADLVKSRTEENDLHAEKDHAKLRTAIIAWVRETGLKALLCPEMTYQVELLRPLLFDPLPDDVKPKVVVRPSYWVTDEAASTYRQAAAVVSLEMHSPIIAVANGRPAIHLRQPTDTRKGQMWRDVGLGDWLFEIDDATGDQIAQRLLSIHREPEKTRATLEKCREFTSARGRAMMQAVAAHL